ncbi:MAG: antitoxin family protein [Anaerolineae bacterium]|nr:antitoxin family protein [Anaerolineae bacterium]
MAIVANAIYEHGYLRLLEPLDLPENTKVKVDVTLLPVFSDDVGGSLEKLVMAIKRQSQPQTITAPKLGLDEILAHPLNNHNDIDWEREWQKIEREMKRAELEDQLRD